MLPLPDWAKDRITSHIEVHLSWPDRFRVLLGGEVWVRSEITVEHRPGRYTTTARESIPRQRWPWSRPPDSGVALTTAADPRRDGGMHE